MIKNTISFDVPGDPKPLKRHRSRAVQTKTGKFFIHNYDPSINEKNNFIAKCLEFKPEQPITAPIVLDIHFYLRRPKSHFRTGKNAGKLKDNAPFFHTKKPDLDNLIKFVKDALNGIFWLDDSQIFYIKAVKSYTHEEIGSYTEIKMSEVEK